MFIHERDCLHTHFKHLHSLPQVSVNPFSCCISMPPCEIYIKANRRRHIQASHSATDEHRGVHALNSLKAEWQSSWCFQSLSVQDRCVCLEDKYKRAANQTFSCGSSVWYLLRMPRYLNTSLFKGLFRNVGTRCSVRADRNNNTWLFNKLHRIHLSLQIPHVTVKFYYFSFSQQMKLTWKTDELTMKWLPW